MKITVDKFEKLRSKIVGREEALSMLKIWHYIGQKVVFTNGCFDLVHRGHVNYLSRASSLGDKMIIGLNTDQSVSRIKGPSRPLQDELSRAEVLASMFFVDAVVLFDEETPFELIDFLKPDILVKGSKIEIYIDAPNHILIADCIELSRYVESNLDREKEDFELQVSSPGATEPFKVIEQYKKYIETKVTVKTKDGGKHLGILKEANINNFVIEETRREKKTLGKGNHTVIENLTIEYNNVKETKSVLPF